MSCDQDDASAPRKCWGALLSGKPCLAGDQVPFSNSTFFGKFCGSCQSNGVLIQAECVRALSPASQIVNQASNGPWSYLVGLPPFRIVNQTGRCKGPRCLIFAFSPAESSQLEPTPELGWSLSTISNAVSSVLQTRRGDALPSSELAYVPLPPDWTVLVDERDGTECVHLILSKGTLVPKTLRAFRSVHRSPTSSPANSCVRGMGWGEEALTPGGGEESSKRARLNESTDAIQARRMQDFCDGCATSQPPSPPEPDQAEQLAAASIKPMHSEDASVKPMHFEGASGLAASNSADRFDPQRGALPTLMVAGGVGVLAVFASDLGELSYWRLAAGCATLGLCAIIGSHLIRCHLFRREVPRRSIVDNTIASAVLLGCAAAPLSAALNICDALLRTEAELVCCRKRLRIGHPALHPMRSPVSAQAHRHGQLLGAKAMLCNFYIALGFGWWLGSQPVGSSNGSTSRRAPHEEGARCTLRTRAFHSLTHSLGHLRSIGCLATHSASSRRLWPVSPSPRTSS